MSISNWHENLSPDIEKTAKSTSEEFEGRNEIETYYMKISVKKKGNRQSKS